MKIGLVTDSTCDIPRETVEELNINVIPVVMVIEGKDVLDTADFSRNEYYERMPGFENHPTTAAPAPKSYLTTYKKLLEEGYDHIISVHASKKLSAIHDTAKMVAADFKDKITVIDSVSLSMGLGYQVIGAAKSLMNGETKEKTIQKMNDVRERVKVFAFLDTMEFARRSGRLSWLKAGVGNLLRIKPILEVSDGLLKNYGQVRSRKQMISRLSGMVKEFQNIESLSLLHTNTLDTVKNLFSKLNIKLPAPPKFVTINPGVGTHTGPDAIGFAILKKNK